MLFLFIHLKIFRFLTTTIGFKGVAEEFMIGLTTVSKNVVQVCYLIRLAMRDEVTTPRTTDEWIEISKRIFDMTGFPHVCGAIDGKLIKAFKPDNSGSDFYCVHKSTFGVILLAVVDGDYRFLYYNIGSKGTEGDSTVFKRSSFYQALQTNLLNIPESLYIQELDINMPFLFLGDNAFEFNRRMLCPFDKRFMIRREQIFNYKMSSTRIIVEQTFGIMVQRFRCLLGPLYVDPSGLDEVVSAIVTLHNFLRRVLGEVDPLLATLVNYEGIGIDRYQAPSKAEEVRQATNIRNILSRHFEENR